MYNNELNSFACKYQYLINKNLLIKIQEIKEINNF